MIRVWGMTGVWRTEVVADMVIRKAGSPLAPSLWLVHALGESSLSFVPLFSTNLSSAFELTAPDLPGAGLTPPDPLVDGLDAAANSLARAIAQQTASRPLGLVGHSLGAAIAVRAARQLATKVVGFFSIEGNLTEADAYLSGRAVQFETPDDFRDHLLAHVRAMAEAAAPAQRQALWRYHASLTFAAAETLWNLGRDAKAAGAGHALGEEYRTLPIPSLYYWSPDSTPAPTQEYLRRHGIPNLAFSGGHWPMVDAPHETADQIGEFFRPLFLAP